MTSMTTTTATPTAASPSLETRNVRMSMNIPVPVPVSVARPGRRSSLPRSHYSASENSFSTSSSINNNSNNNNNNNHAFTMNSSDVRQQTLEFSYQEITGLRRLSGMMHSPGISSELIISGLRRGILHSPEIIHQGSRRFSGILQSPEIIGAHSRHLSGMMHSPGATRSILADALSPVSSGSSHDQQPVVRTRLLSSSPSKFSALGFLNPEFELHVVQADEADSDDVHSVTNEEDIVYSNDKQAIKSCKLLSSTTGFTSLPGPSPLGFPQSPSSDGTHSP